MGRKREPGVRSQELEAVWYSSSKLANIRIWGRGRLIPGRSCASTEFHRLIEHKRGMEGALLTESLFPYSIFIFLAIRLARTRTEGTVGKYYHSLYES